MTRIETLKANAEKANITVMRLVTSGCSRPTMVKAQAARDRAEAIYEVRVQAEYEARVANAHRRD